MEGWEALAVGGGGARDDEAGMLVLGWGIEDTGGRGARDDDTGMGVFVVFNR